MAIKRNYSKLSLGQRKLLAKIYEHGSWSGGQFLSYIYCCEDGYIEAVITDDDDVIWVLTDEGRAILEKEQRTNT